MKSIYDLAHYTSAFGKAIMITNCNTDCRRNLCNHTGILISQSIPYLVHMCTDGNSSCRAVNTTLSTVYTLCFCDLLVKCRHDHSLSSTERKTKSSDSLKFLTGTYTVTAEDTFIRITDNGR